MHRNAAYLTLPAISLVILPPFHRNVQFRNLVKEKRKVYVRSHFKRDKRMIAESIVKTIGAMEPPGRFLAKDPKRGGLWFSIGSDRAREKASQALRENSQRVREEIEQETMQKHAEESMPPAMPSLQPRHYPHLEHHHHHHPGAFAYGMPHPHHALSHPAAMPPGAAPGWGYPYFPAGVNRPGAYQQAEKHPSSGTHQMYSAFPDAAALGYNMAHPLNTDPPLPSIPIEHHDYRVPREEQRESTATPSAPTERRSEGESDDLLLSAAESWPLVAHAVSMSPIGGTKKYAAVETQQSNDTSMTTPTQDRFMQGLKHIFSATSFDPLATSFSNEEMYPVEDLQAQQPPENDMYSGAQPEAHHSKRRLSLSYVAREEADLQPKNPKLQESSYQEQDPTEPLDLNMASPSSPNPSMVQPPIFMERQNVANHQHQHVCSLTPVGASCFSALEDMLRYVGSSSSGNNMEGATFGGYSTNTSTAAVPGDGSFTSSFSSSASMRGGMEDESTEPVMFSPRAA